MEVGTNSILVSIIVCTYNRAKYLEKCLNALANQNPIHDAFEIIIINNNSKDNTQTIAEKYTSNNKYFRHVFEEKQGLSYARNRGIEESSAKWLCFIDDDAIPFPNYLEELVFLLKNYDYDCVGGPGIPIYNGPPPKWSHRYNDSVLDVKEIVDLPVENYIAGFNCIFKKDVIVSLGQFHPELGMKGDKIGYGEETLLQIKIRKNKGKIGYDPNLVVYHLIDKYKLKFSWYFTSMYAHGIYYWKTFDERPTIYRIAKLFFNMLKSILFHSTTLFIKIFEKDYYFQNYFIDVFHINMRLLGMIVSGIKLILIKNKPG